MYKIEHNVPIVRTANTKVVYPFAEMKVGDSFTAPLIDRSSAIGAAKVWGDRQDVIKTFVSRKIDHKTVRIWRVS